MEGTFSTTLQENGTIPTRTESPDESLNDEFYIKNDPYNHLKGIVLFLFL